MIFAHGERGVCVAAPRNKSLRQSSEHPSIFEYHNAMSPTGTAALLLEEAIDLNLILPLCIFICTDNLSNGLFAIWRAHPNPIDEVAVRAVGNTFSLFVFVPKLGHLHGWFDAEFGDFARLFSHGYENTSCCGGGFFGHGCFRLVWAVNARME